MSKMVQIRHVPDGVHRKLKARAAMAGTTLTEYLLREVKRIAEEPTDEEIWTRLAQRSPVKAPGSIVRLLREERQRR